MLTKRIIFAFIFVVCSISSFAIKEYTLSFNKHEYSISSNDAGEMTIELSGNDFYLSDTLLPALPYTSIKILVPPCTKVINYQCDYKTELLLKNVKVAHNPRLFATSDNNVKQYRYTPIEYLKPTYPQTNIEYGGVNCLGGFYFATFNVCPFIYDNQKKTLQFITTLNISFEIEEQETIKDYSGYKYFYQQTLSELVINWNEFSSMYNEIRNSLKRSSPVVDSLDYVIITHDSLAESFRPLIDWKVQKGVRAEILSLSEINDLYPELQYDVPLQIKTAIYNLYNNRKLKWVLLGGDSNIIPVRYCHSLVSIDSTTNIPDIPTDLYYASLDVEDEHYLEWDIDDDHIYGELNDSVNLFSSVFLSRLPVRSNMDVCNIINKILHYEQEPDNDYVNNMLLVGLKSGQEFSPSFEQNSKSHGHVLSLSLYSRSINYESSEWEGDMTLFCDTGTSFPDSSEYDVSTEHLHDQLNSGYHITHVFSHGDCWGLLLENDDEYTVINANALCNSNHSISVVTSCFVNAFDSVNVSLSESLINNPDGGSIAFWGSSRQGWYVSNSIMHGSIAFSASFFKTLFSANASIVDNYQQHKFAAVTSIAKNIQASNSSSISSQYRRRLLFSMNALGDPEMPIYTQIPSEFQNISITSNGADIVVNTGGIDSCTIALTSMDGGDSYFAVSHNTSSATFANVMCPFNIVISKHNYVPYRVSCPDVYVQNYTFNSDAKVEGKNIYIGKNVNPNGIQGEVFINSDLNVIFDAANDTYIKNGFSIESGSTLLIK